MRDGERIKLKTVKYVLKLIPNYNQILPFQVNSCDTKHNSFEPKNHEEPLGKGAVSYAFTITASLDEELDEGLFVLLLQPVQRHRQRHGRFGWAPRTAATLK